MGRHYIITVQVSDMAKLGVIGHEGLAGHIQSFVADCKLRYGSYGVGVEILQKEIKETGAQGR